MLSINVPQIYKNTSPVFILHQENRESQLRLLFNQRNRYIFTKIILRTNKKSPCYCCYKSSLELHSLHQVKEAPPQNSHTHPPAQPTAFTLNGVQMMWRKDYPSRIHTNFAERIYF